MTCGSAVFHITVTIEQKHSLWLTIEMNPMPSTVGFLYSKSCIFCVAVLPPVDDFVVTSINGTIVNTRWQHMAEAEVVTRPSSYTLYWCKGVVSSSHCRVGHCLLSTVHATRNWHLERIRCNETRTNKRS